MRKVENLDAFHTLEQLQIEIYHAARTMEQEDRLMEGKLMREAATKALSTLVHGCSTKNDSTFVPYIEGAHGYNEELRQHLRICRRLRLLPDSESAFLLQRQQSLSSQLVRLLRRTLFNAEQHRHGKGTIELDPANDETPEENFEVVQKRPDRKPARTLKRAAALKRV